MFIYYSIIIWNFILHVYLIVYWPEDKSVI